MLHPEQPSGVPTHPHAFNTLTSHSSGLSDSEAHCSTMGSSPTSYSPKSPVYSESPTVAGGSSPSAKHSKKKARNRPPKHIRKGTVVTRKPEDIELVPGRNDSGEISPAETTASSDTVGPLVADQQVAASPLSRLMSAPINVPARHIPDPKAPASLKIEAFSSPKWLGTGFSDQMESRLHVAAGPRCSGPMIDTSSGQFTYFANSMW